MPKPTTPTAELNTLRKKLASTPHDAPNFFDLSTQVAQAEARVRALKAR
ncbi:hypothetical protein [Deinococcus sp. 6GRE01]|nr:hypothetical protein [Deinococcus sp. 6GRE01]MCD0155979.1 hypothetical protein [Deinococcus sp. 6GRE01]